MQLSWTLSRYLGTQFLIGIGIVFGACLCLIFMVDLVELTRRAASREAVTAGMVITMSLLKLPNLSETALPFAVLFGAIWTFMRLTRLNELVVVRASGVSVWQFLAPALTLAIVIGAFVVTLYNPLAATLVGSFERLEAKYLRSDSSMLAVEATGFWLRQSTGKDQAVVHALRVVEADPSSLVLQTVTAYLYEFNDNFVGRIDAESAELERASESGAWEWHIRDGELSRPGKPVEKFATFNLATSLSPGEIQESMSSPHAVSFWELPRFIKVAEAAGFSARAHRVQWHSLLATPFLLAAMVFLAATFSLRLTRLGGVPQLAVAGILAGFLLYFLSDLASALGLSGRLPPSLAAWVPTLVALLIGLTMLFHLEDG